jgi:hypothetical protein
MFRSEISKKKLTLFYSNISAPGIYVGTSEPIKGRDSTDVKLRLLHFSVAGFRAEKC